MKPANDRIMADNCGQLANVQNLAVVYGNRTKNTIPNINGAFRPLGAAPFLRCPVISAMAVKTKQSKHIPRTCNNIASFLSFRAIGQIYVDRSAEANEAVRTHALHSSVAGKTRFMGP